MPVPELIAHRGYQSRYPENTRIGIEAALEAGARFVEFDIQLTADGVPVLSHDASLSRTAGVATSIPDTELAQLAGVCVGEPARLGDGFPQTAIPTLAEIVDLLAAWPRVTAFVEVKEESLRRFGTDFVVAKTLAVLEPHLAQYRLTSFDIAAPAHARHLGAAGIGWVLRKWNKKAHAAALALAPEYLFCNRKRVPGGPRPLWPGPWQWALYETSDPELALALGERGADLVMTFAIGEMLQHPAFGKNRGGNHRGD